MTENPESPFRYIGRIGRAHGLKGEVRVHLEPGTETALETVERLFIENPVRGAEPQFLELLRRKVRLAGNYAILALHDYKNRNEAERLRETDLYVHEQDLPELEENEYYVDTGIGFRVENEEGAFLGILQEILETAAHPIFRIVDEQDREILMPAIPDFVVEINEEKERIVVRPPEGLLDLYLEKE